MTAEEVLSLMARIVGEESIMFYLWLGVYFMIWFRVKLQ